jgi:colanic acid biosynthesis glycosyl transferase WcaI
MSMKVLLYGLNYAPEPVGIGKYSAELAQWLAVRGHDVRVITAPPYFPQWKASGNRYQRARSADVDVWRCPLWVPRRPSGLTRLLHLSSFAFSSMPVLLAQWSWRPQVVITVAPAFFCAPATLLFTALCGKPTRSWLHIQDFELDAAFELGLLKGQQLRNLAERWERRTLQGFDRVSTISQAMVRHTIAKGVRPSQCLILPNWVDLDVITPQTENDRITNPYRKELGIRADQLVLLYSGSMNQKQGLEMLVEAIRQLVDLPGLVWLLAGDGPSRAELEEATWGMNNVRLMPLQPAERLNDWLNLADVHLLPQKAGAADLVLPSKLLGILASGRPFVAGSPEGSELGDLAELAGIRVDPQDGPAFAEALRRLLADRALREHLGKQGRLLAEQRYGRDSVLNRLERELMKLGTKSLPAP